MDLQQATNLGELAYQLSVLWQRQVETWPMLAEGVTALREARTRAFRSTAEGHCSMQPGEDQEQRGESRCRFPGRAAVFPVHREPSIAQASVPYRDRWLILCNPAPLFEPHYTVAAIDHEPQRVGPAIEGLLTLSRDLDGRYTVFYNGPASGASAPDHLHLQASHAARCRSRPNWPPNWLRQSERRGSLAGVGTRGPSAYRGDPPESAARHCAHERRQGGDGGGIAGSGHRHWSGKARRSGANAQSLRDLRRGTMDHLVFPPRGTSAPLLRDGPDHFLISPGAADLAGVVVTPRPDDFERLTDEIVQTLFREVLLSPEAFAKLRDLLARKGAST